MIGILINNNGKTLFTALPKETEKLEKQLSGIGLNVPMQAVNLSNHNDIGYELDIYAQSQIDMEIASRIILHDNIRQLNDLMLYISHGDADKMYDRICESHAETISDLYNELTTPPELETTDKLVIRTTLNYNANFYEPADCIVEKVRSKVRVSAVLAPAYTMVDNEHFKSVKNMIIRSAAEIVHDVPVAEIIVNTDDYANGIAAESDDIEAVNKAIASSVVSNDNSAFASAAFGLMVNISRIIYDDYDREQRKLSSKADKKLRKAVERKMQETGIKSEHGQSY